MEWRPVSERVNPPHEDRAISGLGLWRMSAKHQKCAKTRRILSAAVMVASALAQACSADPLNPAHEPDLVLLPESTLVSGCFGWPEQEFSPVNNAGGVDVCLGA